jgi:hypothetical protein
MESRAFSPGHLGPIVLSPITSAHHFNTTGITWSYG